jgi:hypothetical protein
LSSGNIETVAKETGFVKRISVVNGSNFLELLLRNSTKGSLLSLEDLARDFLCISGKSISKQGLDERLNADAVNFLQNILSKLIKQKVKVPGINTDYIFSSCRLRDSTRFGLPESYASKYKGYGGATNTAALISIQHEFDLFSGDYLDLKLTSGCRNDQEDTYESLEDVDENELLIRDLGYITTNYLSGVSNKGAYFLNRFPTQMNAYSTEGSESQIDFKKVLNKLKRYKLPFIELSVLVGKKTKIPCRLIISLCDKKAADKRLSKTTKNTKSTGHKVSEKTKTRSKLNIYITNAPKEKIEAKHIYHIYSLRWQIELVFKAWKSICQIDKIKKVKIERFECILLAGLIWTLVNWKAFQFINKWLQVMPDKNPGRKQRTLSIWKYYRLIENNVSQICNTLFGYGYIDDWLVTILNLSETQLFRETKKGKPSYNQLVNLLAKN